MYSSTQRFIIGLSLLAGALVIFFSAVSSPSLKGRLQQIPGLASLIKQREAIKYKASVITLNHEIPDFQGFVSFYHSSRNSPSVLSTYIDYYEAVTQVFPDKADAYAALGFSFYYMGDYEKAVKFYQEAIKRNDQIFYFHYDLGFLYLKEARYSEAAQQFEKALACDAKSSLEYVYSSKVFLPLIGVMTQKQKANTLELKKDYEGALKLFTLAKYCLSQNITQKTNLGSADLKLF